MNWTRATARLRDDDQGSIVSFLIVIFSVMVVLLLVAQAGIFAYSAHVAGTAAREIAQEAAAENSGGIENGTSDHPLLESAGSWITTYDLSGYEAGSNVVVTIDAEVRIIVPIPGLELSFQRQAISKVERFYNASEVAG